MEVFLQASDIENPFEGAKIYYKNVTDSTMNDARSLISDNPVTGTVVSAGEQLSGRGRVYGRKWQGGRDLSLMFTLLLKEDDIPFYKTLFPLFAGFCIMNCLEKHYSIKSRVKWPNDVLVQGNKISGILCENTDSYILCGCGINLNQKDFPVLNPVADEKTENRGKLSNTSKNPVSLYQLTGKTTKSDDFLVKLLEEFRAGENSSEWKKKLADKLYLKGEYAVISEGIPGKSEKIEGLIEGLGEYGQLILKDIGSGNLREVYSGEIY